jgi:Raf kinase inhibitor-like YbhB/YbcL family protein
MALMHEVKVLFGKALSGIHAGEERLASQNIKAPAKISLHSTAFGEGAMIPPRYSGEGANVSPPLAWSGMPTECKELVLVCEDPDAPMPQPYIHWIAFGILPSVTSLPEGVPAKAEAGIGGMKQGKNSSGKVGYTGPMPPLGHGVHHYHFQLFALDAAVTPGLEGDRKELVKAMAGHVIAEGELVGTYERK